MRIFTFKPIVYVHEFFHLAITWECVKPNYLFTYFSDTFTFIKNLIYVNEETYVYMRD